MPRTLKVAVLGAFIHNVLSANILFIGGIPSPSHHIFNRVLAFALAEKGYNVTMIGHDNEADVKDNFSYIQMEGCYELLDQNFKVNDLIKMNMFQSTEYFFEWGNAVCVNDFKSNGLKRLMEYPPDFQFDVIIFDVTLGQCLYPLIDRFNKPPVIAITAFLLPNYMSAAMGNHIYSSYYPHYNLQVSNKMTFFQRVHSFILTYAELANRNYLFAKQQDSLAREYFGANMRPMAEVERSIALLLSNTDPLLDYPVALSPNIIPIGGMHIQPSKKLPKDIKNLMDGAKDGVIYFSLGTNIQSHLLSNETKQTILTVFSKLNQTVLWKYEGVLENLPANVKTQKFLPQRDILGHPNCKIFISHCGALSTQEAIYFGVPVLGMPGFADQHKNAYRLQHRGLGRKIGFEDITEVHLHEVISDLLDDSSYINNMKEASRKFRDQPQTPLDRAVFWTEYVIRHKGAKDLELPARDMYFYQTTNIDVIAFLIVVEIATVLIICAIIKCLFCESTSKKTKFH